jgi:hypothetical protein
MHEINFIDVCKELAMMKTDFKSIEVAMVSMLRWFVWITFGLMEGA